MWSQLARDAAIMLPDYPPRAVDAVDLDTGVTTRILETGPAFVVSYAINPTGDRAAFLAYDPDTQEDIVAILTLVSDRGSIAAPITARLPSLAATSDQALNRPAAIGWADAAHVAHVSWRTGAVTLFDAADLTVDCAWQVSAGDRRRRAELVDHADDGVLLLTSGPALVAGYATGGPFATIRRSSPEPHSPVVTLPAFDAEALLGVPKPCPAGRAPQPGR